MAITYVSDTQGTVPGSGSGNAATVTKPTGATTGDILVVRVVLRNAASTITPPAGWTSQDDRGPIIGDTWAVYMHSQVFTKVLGGSEPSSYTFTCTNNYAGYWSAHCLRGATFTAANGTTNTSASNTHPAPTVTASAANSLHLAFVSSYATGSGNSHTPPSGYTEVVDSHNNISVSVAYKTVASGATGTQNFTGTGGGGSPDARIGQSLVFAPTNTAPNAPTLVSPVGATVIDKDVSQVFSWTFSDPDAGDSQSAYEFRYRLVGAGSWTTTGQVVSTTASRTVSASTFAAGDYEWQVSTYDALGLQGPFSSSAYFTAAATPATPTITAPTSGGTIASNPFDVTWSAPSQTSFQVRTVRDNAGVIDTATIYTDTSEVVDSVSRSRSVAFATNSRWEWVQVRIKASGLFSAWASHRANVSYTPPATATTTFTSTDKRIQVTVVNPTPSGGQPAVDHNEIRRQQSADGGTTWTNLAGDVDGYDVLKGATSVANNGTYEDPWVASGISYRYAVVVVGQNTTESVGSWDDA